MYNATIKRGSQQENHHVLHGFIVSEASKVCTNERYVIFSIELYIRNSPSVDCPEKMPTIIRTDHDGLW